MNEQPVIAPVLEIAADLLDQRSLRALDALQLATAISVREQGEDEIRFIASDKTLLQAAELEGFQIWNPLGVD
jgi:hypothetical protein